MSPAGTGQALIPEPPTLETCANEPIHIPGAIQPGGALLGFDRTGRFTHASANALALLGALPVLGSPFDDAFLAHAPIARDAIARCLNAGPDDGEACASSSAQLAIGGLDFELVLHYAQGSLIAEFEQRLDSGDDIAKFALRSHGALLKLKRQSTIEELLQTAVSEVRSLTGFDRVMGYRFRHDDSGEVVSESVAEGLEPYLGRRYPASDIPAQARRLYIVSTLRLIRNTHYEPVPVYQLAALAPLDMSHCVLRSVSPIHIEYLHNIGVGASMSVSIVVNGRLWGMIACHHSTARTIPYSLRMACDVLAQILASSVQEILARGDAARLSGAALLHTQLVEGALQQGHALEGLAPHLDAVRRALGADCVVATLDDDIVVADAVHLGGALAPVGDDRSCGIELVNVLSTVADAAGEAPGTIFNWSELASMPPAVAEALHERYCGLLAFRFHSQRKGWLVALRKEQIETVRWGGKPEKVYQIGPSGWRLTPRGSFAEWCETVRGTSAPWEDVELRIARELSGGLVRVLNSQMADEERSRNEFIAILSHDLRGPLHAINVASELLQRGKATERMIGMIRSSSQRLQRLVDQMLDVSRLRNGLGLGLRRDRVDLVAVVQELVQETQVARPDRVIVADLLPELWVKADRDRLLQMLGNLISNALHHGAAGSPVEVAVRAEGPLAVVRMCNVGLPIPAEVEQTLFDPFKRLSPDRTSNRTGLGLGLYIAQEIALGHGGTISYAYEAPRVIFEVTMAAHTPNDDDAP